MNTVKNIIYRLDVILIITIVFFSIWVYNLRKETFPDNVFETLNNHEGRITATEHELDSVEAVQSKIKENINSVKLQNESLRLDITRIQISNDSLQNYLNNMKK